MYDGLYRILDGLDVEVVVHADHPTLNRRVAELLRRGERIDVLSTHSKYAPSQAEWLRPLDALVDRGGARRRSRRRRSSCAASTARCSARRATSTCASCGRTARGSARAPVPATWAELAESGHAFGFPGRESGLFGTFFELVTVHGGRLFDDGAAADDRRRRRAARGRRCCWRSRATRRADLPDWHYDEVDAALGAGRVALAAAWPGATGALRASAAGRELEPHPYLSGPLGLRSYAGCHAWAIPKTCGDLDGARALVERLCSAEAQRLEAASGAVCARVDVFAAERGSGRDRRAPTRDHPPHHRRWHDHVPAAGAVPGDRGRGWGGAPRGRAAAGARAQRARRSARLALRRGRRRARRGPGRARGCVAGGHGCAARVARPAASSSRIPI